MEGCYHLIALGQWRGRRVIKRHKMMSAMAAAFAGSGHGGPVPKIAPNTSRAGEVGRQHPPNTMPTIDAADAL
jgi:hypothetical protein